MSAMVCMHAEFIARGATRRVVPAALGAVLGLRGHAARRRAAHLLVVEVGVCGVEDGAWNVLVCPVGLLGLLVPQCARQVEEDGDQQGHRWDVKSVSNCVAARVFY